VRKESFHEVLLLYIRLVKQNERRKPSEQKPEEIEGSFQIGDTIFVPAQNDDWW